MSNLTSAINVQVDKKEKEQATQILKDLGLNMSVAINMFIKQIIKTDGIPFEVKNLKPTKELMSAISEGEAIYNAKGRKGYDNMEDLIKSLNDE
ncbi:MAG: type II toxin-antitoxin system RelB/DinJ family antitoxin [Bacilli bacterium]|nr:type II toxin-antitoxin system RelB/DinJ family antitoxin [Bacilli bacterium]